jgi:4a-hydroxytetrahydrobiopterin dehydratase
MEQLMGELADAWEVREGFKLSRRFKFKDFLHAFGMASQVALLAQEEGHHPDMTVGWGYVGIELTTHAAGGLTKNDFVFAAKVDQL